MNCFYHPDLAAVSSCPDCNKGLCQECTTNYTLPICRECNLKRAAHDRTEIIKDFVIIFGLGAVITFIMTSLPTKTPINLPITTYIMMFYTYSGMIAGWRFLDRFTADYFLVLPIIGWVIYFMVKLFVGGFIGIFVLPYRVYKNIMRLKELKQIN